MGAAPATAIGTDRRPGKGRPPRRTHPPEMTTAAPRLPGAAAWTFEGVEAYFFGIIEPVCRYRLWKPKASSNMCGEWRPALGFFMARFT